MKVLPAFSLCHLLLTAALPTLSHATEPFDRTTLMSKSERTTDDPRRVPVAAGYRDHQGALVLVGGRVFDGTSRAVRLATVVTQGKRISAILKPGDTRYPEGGEVINISGKTLMPGLIDLHSHLTYTEPGLPSTITQDPSDAALRGVERLRYYIESGVTTVRDLASHGDAIFRLKDWVNQSRLPGPRIFAAGQMIVGKGGHGTEGSLFVTAPENPQSDIREASGPDDWRQAVREQFKRGADLIKLGSHYSPLEIQAAVDEAHALGLRVTVDAETQYIAMAAEAGVDCIEHPLPRSDSTIRLMAKRGIAAVPTIVTYDIIINEAGGYFGSTSRRFTLNKQTTREMLSKLKNAGIKLGIATDLVAHWFRYLPDPYIAELKSFVEAGFTNRQALITATRINAEILGMEDKLGSVEAGKLADLIIIDGAPDKNLEDLARIDLVIQNGRVTVNKGQLIIPRHRPVEQ